MWGTVVTLSQVVTQPDLPHLEADISTQPSSTNLSRALVVLQHQMEPWNLMSEPPKIAAKPILGGILWSKAQGKSGPNYLDYQCLALGCHMCHSTKAVRQRILHGICLYFHL